MSGRIRGLVTSTIELGSSSENSDIPSSVLVSDVKSFVSDVTSSISDVTRLSRDCEASYDPLNTDGVEDSDWLKASENGFEDSDWRSISENKSMGSDWQNRSGSRMVDSDWLTASEAEFEE